MSESTIGIHLLVLPESNELNIPDGGKQVIDQAVHQACRRLNCTLYATSIRTDHLHILLEAAGVDQTLDVIDAIVDSAKKALRSFSTSQNTHEKNNTLHQAVHITIIPPWHLEIMAAFVRDQDRFHQLHSVEEEIANIFMPNRVLNESGVPS